jgi:hypothetical protein
MEDPDNRTERFREEQDILTSSPFLTVLCLTSPFLPVLCLIVFFNFASPADLLSSCHTTITTSPPLASNLRTIRPATRYKLLRRKLTIRYQPSPAFTKMVLLIDEYNYHGMHSQPFSWFTACFKIDSTVIKGKQSIVSRPIPKLFPGPCTFAFHADYDVPPAPY